MALAFFTREKPVVAAIRAGSRTQAELLFQPRYRLLDGTLVALQASAAHPRPRLHRGQPPAREIRDIGRDGAMLRDACRLAAGYQAGGAAPAISQIMRPPTGNALILSLRITEAQAASGLLARLIGEVLADSRLPPERMELEFSEGSLQADEGDMLYLLAALRDLGVGLVLGGFGSGVSSLTLLRRRSLAGLLTGLKLDPILVRDLAEESRDTGFLHGLTDSAHALGLLVLADGIETAPHHQRLLEAGCDQGLGTWLGEAEPAVAYMRAEASRRREMADTR